MATIEECRAALDGLAKRLSGADSGTRKKVSLDRKLACRITDLDATFVGQLHDGELTDIAREDGGKGQPRPSTFLPGSAARARALSPILDPGEKVFRRRVPRELAQQVHRGAVGSNKLSALFTLGSVTKKLLELRLGNLSTTLLELQKVWQVALKSAANIAGARKHGLRLP